MTTDEKLVAGKLRRWKKYLLEYELPSWENIPDIGLYMEQVIILLKQYLDYLPPELKEEQFITASTINNYVRMKVIPEPVKKRYYRVHIAYLIMVLTMKTGIEISLIQKLVPSDMASEEIQTFYQEYSLLHKKTCEFFTECLASVSGPILGHELSGKLDIEHPGNLVAFSAIMSGFSHLFSEKLLLLEDKVNEDKK